MGNGPSLFACPACGGPVSYGAASCPHCGYHPEVATPGHQDGRPRERHVNWLGAVVLVIAIGIWTVPSSNAPLWSAIGLTGGALVVLYSFGALDGLGRHITASRYDSGPAQPTSTKR